MFKTRFTGAGNGWKSKFQLVFLHISVCVTDFLSDLIKPVLLLWGFFLLPNATC